MKVFIDFDDVIFNTKEFKHDFKRMFIENGISGEIFDKYYNDPNDTRAVKTFDPWKQIERIHGELNIDTEEITRHVNDFIADMSVYVFDDVKDFVREIGAENICIVSFGEKELQTRKIVNSKIGDFICNIVITDNSKSESIMKILNENKLDKNEKIFFLDDRTEQINDIKKTISHVTTIFVKRPEGRYQEMVKDECCDHEAHNLKEALEIIVKTE